ncbi:MAG: NHL repeat-containing protein [Syntrophothermus sp.]
MKMGMIFRSGFLLILLTSLLHSQVYIFDHEFGQFSSASAIGVSNSSDLYVADKETNEIYKFDMNGRLNKTSGGYGWEEGLFDNPVSIFATPIYVLVTDYNNHRIEIFDRDLNYISQINGRSDRNSSGKISFGYPAGCVSSSLGDIFILDRENKQVLKINASGNLQSQFGNYQSGKYELAAPEGIGISPDNRIVVLDSSALKIFDQYGNGIAKITPGFPVKRINITNDKMVLVSGKKLYIHDFRGMDEGIKELQIMGYDIDGEITEGLVYKGDLYLLTAHQVLVYKKKEG